jgi:hypothetical protein
LLWKLAVAAEKRQQQLPAKVGSAELSSFARIRSVPGGFPRITVRGVPPVALRRGLFCPGSGLPIHPADLGGVLMAVQQAADRVQVGSSPAHEERRQSHRSDPAFQNRFRLALMKLVFTALVPTVVLSLIVSHTVLYPDAFLDSPWVLLATAVASIAVGVLILQRCDKVSNRYCGPTYRIVEALKAIHRGERAQPVKVRKNDEFEELVHHLNRTFVELGLMDDGDR